MPPVMNARIIPPTLAILVLTPIPLNFNLNLGQRETLILT